MSFAKHILRNARTWLPIYLYFDYFVWGDKTWYRILLVVKLYRKSYDIEVIESYLNTVKTIMKIKLNVVQIYIMSPP